MSPCANRRSIGLAGLLALALAAGAVAQTAGPSPQPEHMPPQAGMGMPEMGSRAARRFPQPVRADALIGRDLLEPREPQPVLGRVTNVLRRGDGSTELVVRVDGSLGLGWLGLSWLDWWTFGSRLVTVPIEGVALLGEHVALLGLTPQALRAQPDYVAGSASEIESDATIRVGIVRPFH